MFKTRYRIVEAADGLYKLELKYWWCPFWLDETPCWYETSVESLERYVERLRFKSKVVKEL